MKDKLSIAHSGCFRKQKLYGYDQEKKNKHLSIRKEALFRGILKTLKLREKN